MLIFLFTITSYYWLQAWIASYIKSETIKSSHLFSWEVKPKEDYYYHKPFPLSNKGIIGNYIYINYIIRSLSDKYPNNRRCLYLKNLKSGKIYNINSKKDKNSHGTIYDDFYHTGYFDLMRQSNKPGYFYFIRQNNVVRNQIDNLNANKGVVFFIVKTKE